MGGLFLRGPLCLLLGFLLPYAERPLDQLPVNLDMHWVNLLGMAFLIAGVGLLIRWMLQILRADPAFANRLGSSLIGIGWLAYGIQPGYFLSLFLPPGNLIVISPREGEIVLTNLLLVAGAVVLVMANGDLFALLFIGLIGRLRKVAPVSRTSVVYPLTFRFRTEVTVTLLGLVTFLMVLIVTLNLGSVSEAQATITTGGFQLQEGAVNSRPLPANLNQQIQANPRLRRDIAACAWFRTASFGTPSQHMHGTATIVLLPGQVPQGTSDEAQAWDDTYLSTTTMPMQVRAQGYATDRQVWDAVKNQPNLVVMRYDKNLHGLPTSNGFRPFQLKVIDTTGHYHLVSVIGIVSANTQLSGVYLSMKTAMGVDKVVSTQPLLFIFRTQPGVSELQAARDLTRALHPTYGLTVVPFDSGDANTALANMTLLLSGYLVLGLLFGIVAIGVIMGRAVVERRQQIGMLRAIGFSRGLVLGSFLLEAGFIVTISLLVGTALAMWTVSQVTSTLYQDFPVPVQPIILILAGTYLVAFFATALPARNAAKLRPAEALRYE